MAFKATGRTTSEALNQARSVARTVKTAAQSLRDKSAVEPVNGRSDVILYMDTLQNNRTSLGLLTEVSGITTYAQDQHDDASYDIIVEASAMLRAMDRTITWIDDNIPKDAGGRWVEIEEIVSGRLVERTLSTAQTSGLRVELDNLLTTIE